MLASGQTLKQFFQNCRAQYSGVDCLRDWRKPYVCAVVKEYSSNQMIMHAKTLHSPTVKLMILNWITTAKEVKEYLSKPTAHNKILI